jgi:hypothetical protein
MGDVRGNSRDIVYNRVSAKLFAFDNLKLGDSFQHASLIMIAGFANTGILDRINHGIYPFNRQYSHSFSLAKDMPIIGR